MQVETYFALMTDVVRLGLAPRVGGGTGWGFQPPRALSTGMHAALLATQLCEEVNLFGFSGAGGPGEPPAPGRPDRYYEGGVPGEADWGRRAFEARALQMLHLSSHAALCTR